MQFTDAVTVAGKPRRTADGYLVAEAKCVRTGIQLYAGDEVGRADLSVVRVYRPEAEVFADAALQSFTHAPVTVDHPKDMVTADNWKDLAVGEVSTAAKRDGEWVMLPLILKDAAAIQAVTDGKRELSAGYTCTLDWTPGTTPAGEAYDAIQCNIKINHLALVDRARAGSQARIGDGAEKWGASPVTETPKKELIMADAIQTKTVIVDGLSVITTDQGEQAIVKLQKQIADATAASAKVLADHTAALAAKDADLAKKDAEIDGLKKQVVDAATLDKLVASRANLVTVAKAIAKDLKTEGLSDADIKKAAVVAALGDAAVKDKSADYINARFDILAEDAAKKAANPADPFAAALQDGIQPTGDANKAVTDAYAQMVKDMQSAHLPAKAN
jgi:hypothetical protein